MRPRDETPPTPTTMPEEDDASLARRSPGDPTAFAALYDRYFARLYNFVRWRIEVPGLAEDLVSEAFERAFRGIARFDPGRGSFGAWLFSIARHLVVDELRKRSRQRTSPLEDQHDLVAGDPSPEDALARGQELTLLLTALRRLPERDQDVLSLRFAARLSNREIARQRGIGEGHAAVLVHRALCKLRKEVEKAEGNHGQA
ncbi:MAG: sigma-70 family RNA polymerase sigma factor [Acidobacteria bacterium]|nr:sigma-70 family RNA polymerase sigma factor [Acidobacteriota bacterium]